MVLHHDPWIDFGRIKMSSCILSPETTATRVSFSCSNDPFSGAVPVRKAEIELNPPLEFQKRHVVHVVREKVAVSEIISHLHSSELATSLFEYPFLRGVNFSTQTIVTPRANMEPDSFEYLEDSDFHMPPNRRYRGRIYIRERYRAIPKYCLDEWTEGDE